VRRYDKHGSVTVIRLSSPPQTIGYVPALDGLRAVAVLLVLAAHLGIPNMTGGVIGVDLFFVLSGFLITALLLQERERNGEVHYPAFYLRRALRLFPALAILLPVVAVAAHLSPGVDKATADLTTGGIPWVALYAANWARATGTQLGLFGHTWSLAIEEQFYLLWPTALFLLVRKRADYSRAVVLALAVAALVAAHRALEWLQGAGIDRVANGTDMRADALLIGCATALALHAGFRLRAPVFLVLVAFAVIGWVVVTQTNLSPFLYLGGLTLVAVCAAVIIVALLERPLGLSAKPFVWVGRISYGLYLWHFPIIFLVPLGWPPPARVVVAMTLTFAAAATSWFLVERRFLRLKPRWQRRIAVRSDFARLGPAR